MRLWRAPWLHRRRVNRLRSLASPLEEAPIAVRAADPCPALHRESRGVEQWRVRIDDPLQTNPHLARDPGGSCRPLAPRALERNAFIWSTVRDAEADSLRAAWIPQALTSLPSHMTKTAMP